MIAAPAQLFNEFGKDDKITKSALKLLLDVLLALDLQEQLNFCIAPFPPSFLELLDAADSTFD